jgi:hypothetical protein
MPGERRHGKSIQDETADRWEFAINSEGAPRNVLPVLVRFLRDQVRRELEQQGKGNGAGAAEAGRNGEKR